MGCSVLHNREHQVGSVLLVGRYFHVYIMCKNNGSTRGAFHRPSHRRQLYYISAVMVLQHCRPADTPSLCRAALVVLYHTFACQRHIHSMALLQVPLRASSKPMGESHVVPSGAVTEQEHRRQEIFPTLIFVKFGTSALQNTK